MPRRGLTTEERGYGSRHRKDRERLIRYAYGTPCLWCGRPMLEGQALDLDHELPLSRGGTRATRFMHAKCNRSRGNRDAPKIVTSRPW